MPSIGTSAFSPRNEKRARSTRVERTRFFVGLTCHHVNEEDDDWNVDDVD